MDALSALAKEIRPYQQEMIDRLSKYPAVLCADEMGLGKTVEAIALDTIRRSTNGPGKTLVVCPLTGVVDSWVTHYRDWRPDLNVRRINPKKRHLLFHDDEDIDVYVIHWDAVRLMVDDLKSRSWLHIIADEVHRIKHRKTKTAKALKQIRNVKYKTGLSGTPMENRPDELWSILNWLYVSGKERNAIDMSVWHQKLLNSYWRFYGNFVDFIEMPPHGYHKVLGPKNEAHLRQLMEPFYIRRLKSHVLDLPPKMYQTYEVDLTPKQRRAYDSMKRSLVSWVGQHEDKPLVAPIVIAQLARLQQFALAFGDLSPQGEVRLGHPSSKIDALLDIVDDLGDSQLVVFSTSRQMVDLCDKELQDRGYSTAKVTGTITDTRRTRAIKDHTEGKAQVFLATIRSGGVGLNLQHCSHMVFLDRDWSPSINRQAEDRLHRGGQTLPVNIIDIVARDTIDQGKAQTLVKKWEWVRAVIGAD